MDINNDDPLTSDKAKRLFPKIDLEGFGVTSDLDPFYNCFAWAGGDNKNVWQPSRSSYYVWLTGCYDETLENFIANYAVIGYKEESDSSLEPDFEKIALYVDHNGIPQHAARQLEDGNWTSKSSIIEDFTHKTPECLECEVAGNVAVILKRPKNWNEK